MKKEIILKGTPKDLALKVNDLLSDSHHRYQGTPVWFVRDPTGINQGVMVLGDVDKDYVSFPRDNKLPDDINPIYLSRYPYLKGGHAVARRIPNGRTLLRINVADDIWPQIESSWDMLIEELEREGWIEMAPKTMTPAEKPKKGAHTDEWFAYYHAMKEAKFKFTLNDIATETGYSYDTIKHLHQNYPLHPKKAPKSTK